MPDEVVQAAVAVLKAWEWAQRPVAVLGLESGPHPQLVESLASRLAEVGRLRNLGMMCLRPDHRGHSAHNSAYRVAGLVDAWDVPGLPTDGPILLVDAKTDTGWTFAMATHALGAMAGAGGAGAAAGGAGASGAGAAARGWF